LTLYGHALFLEARFEEAERVLQQAITRFPLHPSALLEYANAAERVGHLAEARRALVQYGGLIFDDRLLALRAARIGDLSLRLDDLPMAVAWLERARTAMPTDPSVLAALADARLRSGDRAGAHAAALQGLKLEPSSPVFRALEATTRR
jgi:Flp pilus assembly protein TadD